MSARTLQRLLGALGAAAAIWLVVFLAADRAAESEADPVIEGPIVGFFDGVDESTLTAARFTRLGGTVELSRVGEGWEVSGFRSDSGSVARFFVTLGESRVESLAATNPSNHARMGLSADSAARLELEVGGSTRTLLLGLDGPRAATVYARLPDEDAVYLIASGLRAYVFRQLDDWRNRRMLAIDTSLVRRIAVRRDGDAYELVRTDSAWTLANGSSADARVVQGVLTELAGGLVASRFFEPTDSIGLMPLGGTTVAYGASGEPLATVTVGSGSGDRWGMVAGDSVRYRLPSFRVDAIAPTLGSVSR
ncbi:MAG: DUF4340 domain-containing protein [Longimicrobiales bacterium]